MILEDSLVSIRNSTKNERVGAGLLVQPDLILTCAHVVNTALGRPKSNMDRPNLPVSITVHACRSEAFEASIDSNVDAWSPPPASSGPGADLCLLRMRKKPKALPAKLWISDNLISKEYRAGGFPEDWNGDLDISTGNIIGRDEFGLYLLRPKSEALSAYLLQKSHLWNDATRVAGLIYSGFSGAPVEVNGTIVGIITEARAKPTEATAYMIPACTFPDVISGSIIGLEAKKEDGLEFIRQLSQGPSVKETYLVTTALVNDCARHAHTHTDAAGILAKANQKRAEADPQEDRADVSLIEIFMLPNIDNGATAFWHDCMMRACLWGPRMLAAMLVALPEKLFEEEARRDHRNLLKLLLSRYRKEAVVTANAVLE